MNRPDVKALLQELVGIPSLSGREKAAADFMQQYVASRDVGVERVDDNIYFWLGEGDDVLLLNTHLDVVPPSGGHPFDPFTPAEMDGYIYGRGAVDAKASAAAMTVALLTTDVERFRPDGRVVVALTTCEETGGTYNGLETLLPHLPSISAALVGEPTDLRPCVAQKGLLILRVHARGRGSHAARAHLGENAIEKAARDILRCGALSFEREDPHLGYPTATVTTIEGGSARNVVPDECIFTLDLRSTPAYTHAELIAMVRAVLESDVQVHSERLIPVSTPLDERIVRACRVAVPEAEPFGSPTASDWIFLADVPAVKIGPGSSELSHTAGEKVAVDELHRAVNVYRTIIESYFEL